MTWFQVDDCLSDHRKVRKLGDDRLLAVGLWTLCGSWCGANLTDGFVPLEVVDRWDPGLKVASKLVEVGLWCEGSLDGEVGFRFHGWGEYQLTREEVLRRRADARERMRRYRERRDVELAEDFRPGNNVESDTSLLEGFLNTSEETRHNAEETRHNTNGKVNLPGQTGRDASLYSLGEQSSDAAPTLPYLKNKKTSSSKTKEFQEEAVFTEFWNAYPRKQQKQDARKAWMQQRRKGTSPRELIDGARGYAEYHRQRGTDREFIKLPASWLRAGGHEDHQPTQPSQPDTREPVDVLRAFWKAADAQAVATILRIPFIHRDPPPSDTTPRDKWVREYKQSWITDHFEAAVEALKKSREQ